LSLHPDRLRGASNVLNLAFRLPERVADHLHPSMSQIYDTWICSSTLSLDLYFML
jgi:hypothetical protein